MRISDWSSDVCSSDLGPDPEHAIFRLQDNLDIGRHEIGDERRDSYPEIDIKAVFQFEFGAGRHLFACPGHQACSSSRGRVVRNSMRFRSEEHTSELQSLMRISYAVFCLKKKITINDKPVQHISALVNTHALPNITSTPQSPTSIK